MVKKHSKNSGWFNEPFRHGLARHGIKTAQGKVRPKAKGRREEEFEEAKQYRLNTNPDEVEDIFKELFPEENVKYIYSGDTGYIATIVERWDDELHIFETTSTQDVMSQKRRIEMIEDNMSPKQMANLFDEYVPDARIREMKAEANIDDTEELMGYYPDRTLEILTERYSGPYIVSTTYTDADNLSSFINNFPEEEADMAGWAEIEIYDAKQLKDMDVDDFVIKYIDNTIAYQADSYTDYRNPDQIGEGLFKEIPFEVKE